MKNARQAAWLFASCLLVVLAAGCVTGPTPFPEQVQPCLRFAMSIDSIAAPDAASKGKAYLISCGIKDLSEDDLQYKEFAKYVENALAPKGYQRVYDDKQADLLIRLSYGVGTPQTTTTMYTTSYGYSYPVGWMWYTVAPTMGVSQTHDYPISLTVDAYDLKTQGKQPQLWKTTVTGHSRVPNNVEGGIFVVTYYDIADVRIQVPYMIAAAEQYFGTNTGSTINRVIMGSDPRVFQVMGKQPGQP